MTYSNISVTILITGLLSYIISWVVRLLFGYGNSTLANDVKIKNGWNNKGYFRSGDLGFIYSKNLYLYKFFIKFWWILIR